MNQLSNERRVAILSALCEGNSVNGSSRLYGASKATILTLVRNVGAACSFYQDARLRGLNVTSVQCDEMWSFVHTKRKNLEVPSGGKGDMWLWTAIDAETKLFIAWRLGPRTQSVADTFMADVGERIVGTLEIVTDGAHHYVKAVDRIDRPMLCGHRPIIGRYLLTKKSVVTTNHAERLNLSLRTSVRRLSRKTSAFSKSMANHAAMIGIWSMFYNFARIHKSIRVTPAMEAGITDHVWTWKELLDEVRVVHRWNRPDPDGDGLPYGDDEAYCECCGQRLSNASRTFNGRFCSRFCRNQERDHAPDVADLERTA